ncbi:MAG: hypothetical protein V4773_06110 [Verrucomicrobiota bacterium]
MEPIDKRLTAARLMALLDEPDPQEAIRHVLGLAEIPAPLAKQADAEIAAFIASRDATLAAQLIHACALQREKRTPRR